MQIRDLIPIRFKVKSLKFYCNIDVAIKIRNVGFQPNDSKGFIFDQRNRVGNAFFFGQNLVREVCAPCETTPHLEKGKGRNF